jgi:hypothetical protein
MMNKEIHCKTNDITLLKIIFFLFLMTAGSLYSYPYNTHIRAVKILDSPEIDGSLADVAWQEAPVFSDFKMVKPETGKTPSEKTEVRIMYDNKNLYIGVYCYTKDPTAISVNSLQHDQNGTGNDTVRILLDPFLDKRNAYVFHVNPKGARTDGLADGEQFSTNWDGIWDAKSKINPNGWSTEIKIPFKTISFNPLLTKWGLNIERFIAKKIETIRLSGISKDSLFYNPAEAALLSGIKNIKQGKGITFKPYATLETSHDNAGNEKRKWKLNGGFDLYKNFTPNLVGVFTYHTDFAETDADDRRINLTRFSLYYPEKRSFFLEGSDIFTFEGGSGGWSPSFIPFFSRKIGLHDSKQVPIQWGAKVYGKMGRTNLALLDVKTQTHNGHSSGNYFAGRVYQNIFSQSKLGIIFTSGDPAKDTTNTLLGVDFKYSTSSFLKNKNLSVSGWWATNHNDIENGKHYGYGAQIGFPNDLFNIDITYSYFGDAMEPGLGFLPRNDNQQIIANFNIRPRLKGGYLRKLIRQFFFESYFRLYWDLNGNLESSRISFTPLTFNTESGDRFEVFFIFHREVLNEPFEVSDGVIIPLGDFKYNRYQFQFRSAQHRPIDTKIQFETGDFYNGTLKQLDVEANFSRKGNIKMGLSGTFVSSDLPEGSFKENLYRARADFYLNPDMGLMTYVQYDSVSENIGANIRLKWRISPGNTIYLVYNKSWEKQYDRMSRYRFHPYLDRGIIKVQLSIRP